MHRHSTAARAEERVASPQGAPGRGERWNVGTRRQLTLAATVLGSSLAFIDGSVVVVALPTIERDLGLGLSGQEWVVVAYSLALAALLLAAGAVGDRRGRRETLVWGVVGFAFASALAGFSPTSEVLIGARVLQGAAGAFLTVNSLALLREVYGRESGRAVGLWTALTSVALVVGPPVGGALVEWISWRWIFFVNLPLAAATIALALAGRCPRREELRVGRLDLPGSALAAAAFSLLSFALVEGSSRGFAQLWWAFTGSAVALVLFLQRQRRCKEPMLPLGLFRRRNFAVSNLETFFVYAAVGGFLFLFPIYLQFLGFSAVQAGLANLPVSVAMILLAPRFGKLADAYGPRVFLCVGPLLIGAGMLLLLGVDERSALWRFGLPGLLVLGLGLAVIVAPITATALSSAPALHSGIASGINQTVSQFGNVVAVAVLGTVVALTFQSSGGMNGIPLAKNQREPVLRSASVDAFRAAMLVAAGLALTGGVIGAAGISNAQTARQDADGPPIA